MSTSHTPSSTPPSADQLAASRLQQWHQQGEALLTFENLRSWINATGLVLFTSRASQLPAPAPTLVEAVLGATNANPVLADLEQAKGLLARLVMEGIAVPLNLLGTPGETPDFVVSAAVFAYVFTLRGDKTWKQPPATSGAVKVSPLALATYTMLAERVTLSAYDLATQLGKEVTESAVLRALNELWAHLRVLPIPQADGAATLWELTSGRFTKLMKAGANAGQPSALSALISLYLNQAIVATEEEIETFLSPLAARSRIRDVVHALMGARQLETIAIEGKTVLHVAGELPGFLAPEGSVVIDAEAADGIVAEAEGDAGAEPAEGAARITKFVPKPKKIGTGFVVKPVRPAFGAKPGYGADREAARERRPFERGGKPSAGRPAAGKPSFSKPWQEERAARPARDDGEQAVPRTFTPRPGADRGGDRPAYGRKPAFGGKPAFSSRPAFGGKPAFGRNGGEGRPPRREFTPRTDIAASGEARPPRKTYGKPGGFAGKPAFGRDGGEGRPPRRDFGDSRPPRREFTPRSNSEGSSDSRPPRREFGPRSSERPSAGGERPAFGGPRKPGSFSARPQGGFGERKPFVPREGGPSRFGGKPAGGTDRRARTNGPPFRKFDAPRGDRPARPAFGGDGPARPAGAGGFAGKPSRNFAGKKPFSKPSGGKFGGAALGKPAGTFDKFKNNAKPFGNRPPARKYRPEEGESKG